MINILLNKLESSISNRMETILLTHLLFLDFNKCLLKFYSWIFFPIDSVEVINEQFEKHCHVLLILYYEIHLSVLQLKSYTLPSEERRVSPLPMQLTHRNNVFSKAPETRTYSTINKSCYFTQIATCIWYTKVINSFTPFLLRFSPQFGLIFNSKLKRL